MRRPRLLWPIGAVTACAVILFAAGLRGSSGQHSGSAKATEPKRAALPTKRGAVTTASRFLSALTLEVLLDDDRRRQVVGQATTPDGHERLLRLYQRERDRVARSYKSEPRLARAALLGYRMDTFTGRRATVSIWAASIGGSPGYGPRTGWSTTILSLEWDGRRWLIADVDNEPGPSADWPIESLVSEARRFREFRHAP